MPEISPTFILVFGIITTVWMGISSGTIHLTNMLPERYIPALTAWASFFAIVNSAILTALGASVTAPAIKQAFRTLATAFGALLLALALLASIIAGSWSARAADMPIKAPPLALSGSGLYLGINGGAAIADQAYDFVTLPGTGTLHPAGAMAGVTLGFGGSLGGLYAAVESDFDYDFTRSETSCGVSRCGARDSWFLSQRLVLGVPLSGLTGALAKIPAGSLAPPSQWPVPISVPASLSASAIMPFVTGGLYERDAAAFITGQGHADEWMLGYGGGGGLRVPLAAGWSAKAQYEYIIFNRNFVPAGTAAGLFPATFKALNEQRLVLGFDYHF